jgi:hypothetical protein
MRLSWIKSLTHKQKEELAKYCLTLSQATIIGTIGFIFIQPVELIQKIFVTISGFVMTLVLLILGVKILKNIR